MSPQPAGGTGGTGGSGGTTGPGGPTPGSAPTLATEVTSHTPLAEPERLGVAFASVVRGSGIDVPVGNVTLLCEALAELGLAQRDAVYWAGRATLVRRPEQVAAYDGAFAQFWTGVGPARRAPEAIVPLALDEPSSDDGPEADEAGTAPPGEVEVVRYSAVEVLRDKTFAEYTPADFAEAQRLLATLRIVGPGQRSRRLRPSSGGSGPPDLRRTVRAAIRSGGEPRRIARRSPGTRPRRIVLLCDVSGSMEPYSRALLRFAHAAVLARSRVEVFALGTRLSRLTRPLASKDPDAALAAVTRAVPDWSGGTRLGDGLAQFNTEWGVRGMARGAVVVILSDGWDRGDPEALGAQMARLHRVAHRIVWVNPLKASPGYAPLARGMAAALPWVDAFVAGHSIVALEELARIVSA